MSDPTVPGTGAPEVERTGSARSSEEPGVTAESPPTSSSIPEIEARMAEIEERTGKATSGPWRIAEAPWPASQLGRERFPPNGPSLSVQRTVTTVWKHGQTHSTVDIAPLAVSPYGEPVTTRTMELRDAAFVAAAREDVPWLCAALRAALVAEGEARKELVEYEGIEGRCPVGHNKRLTYEMLVAGELNGQIGCVACERDAARQENARLRGYLLDRCKRTCWPSTHGVIHEANCPANDLVLASPAPDAAGTPTREPLLGIAGDAKDGQWFRVRAGVSVRRFGSVVLVMGETENGKTAFTAAIPHAEWCSIVASVSVRGDNAETYKAATELHGDAAGAEPEGP